MASKSEHEMFQEFYQDLLGSQTEQVCDKIMKRDTRREIIKITGRSVEQLCSLGYTKEVMAYIRAADAAKDEHLKNMNDTYFSMPFNESIKIIEGLGFKSIYQEKFKDYHDGDDEVFIIFYHPDGLIMTHESFHGNVNSSHIDYNFLASDQFAFANIGMNRHIHTPITDKDIHICSLDVREGLKYKLLKLSKCGQYVKPWVASDLLLLNYAEFNTLSIFENHQARTLFYNKITQSKIDKFPDYVRKDLGL